MSNLKNKIKTYNDITHFGDIARRYFINNFYDGALTILGILLGLFVVVLNPASPTIDSNLIILPGVSTAISMLISGISGSYLSERAEQKKNHDELIRAMAIIEKIDIIDEDLKKEEEEIKKAMLKPIKLKKKPPMNKKEKKNIRSIRAKAERFAGIIVALVNGGAPFLGGLIPLIPFLFVTSANITIFLISFIIIFACIIFLGVFLGIVSKESIVKNIIQMLAAFILTIVVVILFLG